MPAAERRITAADIIPDADFAAAAQGAPRRAAADSSACAASRSGPYCTVYFESFETMLFQIQEMLLIEKGGDAQLADELAAYNPMIPQGAELVATVMFEIDDPVRRASGAGRAGRGRGPLLPRGRRRARRRPCRRATSSAPARTARPRRSTSCTSR